MPSGSGTGEKEKKNAPRRGGVATPGASRGGRGSRRGSRDGARRNPRRRGFVRERRDIGRRERHARSSAGSCAGSTAGDGGRARRRRRAEKEKTPRETRKRVRWSEGVEAKTFSLKKTRRASAFRRARMRATTTTLSRPRRVRTPWPLRRLPNEPRGTRVAPRSPPPPRARDGQNRRRDVASLPPEVRDEISRFQPGTRATPLGARGSSKARRIHDPTTGESPGGVAFDAFGAHLGVRAARFVPGEAKRPAGPAGPAGPAAAVPGGGAAASKRKDAGTDARRRRLARVLLADRPRGPRGDRRGGGTHAARALRARRQGRRSCARGERARARARRVARTPPRRGQKTRRRFSPRRHRIRRGERASPSRMTATTGYARRISATIAVVIVKVIVKVAILRPRRRASLGRMRPR